MRQIVDNFSELAECLAGWCHAPDAALVTVDGFPGSGKSTLASRLASQLSAKHIELDQFLVKNRGGYLAYLRYEELLRTINQHPKTIVDGVCVKAVLNRIGLTESASVYVKRLVAGIWSDGLNLSETGSAQKAIANEEEIMRRFYEINGDPIPGSNLVSQLDRDVLIYHFGYRPHECSTAVYAWTV
jgi:tRNA uridine 5-carbamoylmethylation protein Kti12